jgi:hypothetical protein
MFSKITKIATGAIIIILIGLSLWLGYKAVRNACHFIREHLVPVALVFGLLIVTIVGMSLYSFRTYQTKQTGTLFSVNLNPNINSSWWSTNYYISYAITPTRFVKPGTNYLVTVDNGIISFTKSVSWNKLELNLLESKGFNIGISEKEYTAIGKNKGWDLQVNSVTHERNSSYIFMIFVYIGIVFLGWFIKRDINKKRETEFVHAVN